MTPIRPVYLDGVPRPKGHYSPAVIHGGLVFVSGQLPMDPETGAILGTGMGEQARHTLRNLQAVLRAAGSDLDRLLQVTIFLTDIAHWDELNLVYADVLGDHRPSRAVIPVGTLHFGALLEIQAIAATP